jgi:hypothetical protein
LGILPCPGNGFFIVEYFFNVAGIAWAGAVFKDFMALPSLEGSEYVAKLLIVISDCKVPVLYIDGRRRDFDNFREKISFAGTRLHSRLVYWRVKVNGNIREPHWILKIYFSQLLFKASFLDTYTWPGQN